MLLRSGNLSSGKGDDRGWNKSCESDIACLLLPRDRKWKQRAYFFLQTVSYNNQPEWAEPGTNAWGSLRVHRHLGESQGQLLCDWKQASPKVLKNASEFLLRPRLLFFDPRPFCNPLAGDSGGKPFLLSAREMLEVWFLSFPQPDLCPRSSWLKRVPKRFISGLKPDRTGGSRKAMEHKEPHSRAESHVCAWVGREEEKRRMLTRLPLLPFSWETTLHPACLTPRCSRGIHCAYRDPVAYFSCETNGKQSLAILASAFSPCFPESVLLFVLVESTYPVLPNSDKLVEEKVSYEAWRITEDKAEMASGAHNRGRAGMTSLMSQWQQNAMVPWNLHRVI